MTSTDGFCSVVVFSLGELGEKYTGPIPTVAPTPASVTPVNPTSTPSSSKVASTPTLPPSPAPPTRQPNSPTRSSSASSVTTLSSLASAINNPTPTVGSLPGVAASVAGVPLTTPPQTPLSVTGSVLGKREEHTPTKKDGKGEAEVSDVAIGGDKKRRRIAPTLVTVDPAPQVEKMPDA